ncbi:MAG: metallophosphatase family protein [Planctomycetes bacterium]|nr:metallophosphatase family protein [Planctomycetota bacterium]
MRRVALVSDTHGLVRPEVLRALAGAERILHMGDVGSPDVLDALGAVAPVVAVRGNVDHGAWSRALPATQLVDAFGASLFLLHNLAELDVDPAAAGIAIVLYGHTHVPKEEARGGVRFVNPGSIGPRRFDLPVSFAFLGEDLAVEFVRL